MMNTIDINLIVKDIIADLNEELKLLDKVPQDIKDTFIEDMAAAINNFAATLEKYDTIFESYEK